jgi:cupin 2 domain-containing protein
MVNNIFNGIQLQSDYEFVEEIFKNHNVWIERIASYGIPSPDKFWYDQSTDEWVMLLCGEAELQFKESPSINLKAGDYVFIPANQEHRVSYVSKEPNCIWLAIHFKTDK